MMKTPVQKTPTPTYRGFLLAAALLVPLVATAGPVASSELKDAEGERYPASNAFDGLLQTAWAEGDMGDGTDAWLELRFTKPTDVKSISIWPGNMTKGTRSLREYGRPHTVTVTLKGGAEEVTAEARLLDPGERGPLRHDVEIEGTARSVRISMDQVYPGGIYNDLFIAEVAVNFISGDVPTSVQRLRDWQESDAGKKAFESSKEEIITLFDTIQAAEFGDRDALQGIMDRAGDGAPYLQRQARTQVLDGYRIQAIPPDATAVSALMKLGDSNAIPAIEQAALRSLGPVARKLRDKVQMFHAYEDLVGGGNTNIPPWGQTGWELGAMKGLGEPIQIEVDNFGHVWIADVANNRVQKYNFQGIVQSDWGVGEAQITDKWFSKTRAHYATARDLSEEAKGFWNPVDLCTLPGKTGDTMYVLDAKGKVTVIDETGVISNSWKIPQETGIIPGAGGEGFIEIVKGAVVVIWGNEGWTYSAIGEEQGHFELEDGSPTGAVPIKNKIGLIYGDKLVQYSLDGYRHGDLMTGAMGKGFEAWDVTLDEEGKLWAVTDKATLVKFKKPGKVAFEVRFAEFSIDAPRIDVYDGFAFVTNGDKITKVDAELLNAEQTLAAAEAGE